MSNFNLFDNTAGGLFGFHDEEEHQQEEGCRDHYGVDDHFDAVFEWASKHAPGMKPCPGSSGKTSGSSGSPGTPKGKRSPKTAPKSPPAQNKSPSSPSDPGVSANVAVKKTRKPRRRNTSFQQWI